MLTLSDKWGLIYLESKESTKCIKGDLKMKKLAELDLREDQSKDVEEGRVFITIASDESIYLSSQAGPKYDMRFGDAYVQVYHDKFISFDTQQDYNYWLKEIVRDYLLEEGMIYKSEYGDLYIK